MMHSPVLLISTDFDGTLVEHGTPAPFSPELVEVLHELRGRGVRWAINTGRTLPWLIDGLRSFALPIHPDFAITGEREVHELAPDGSGWRDFGDWNAVCQRRHDELFARAVPLLERIIDFVRKQTNAELRFARHQDPRNLLLTGEAAELSNVVATSDAEMDRVLEFVDQARAGTPDFSYQRNSIYLAFCHADYDKGTALAELGRQIGVGRESILAIGDHQNDIPMLSGKHAARVACPANSIPLVKKIVRDAGGYVATAGFSAGVIEALRHFCADLL